MARMGAEGYSSSGTARVSAKVPQSLKEEFREACEAQDQSMTDVIEDKMAEFVADHSPETVADDQNGHYPDDAVLRERYEACLDISDDNFKIYQRRHAGQLADRTNQFSKDELADAMMPLRKKGYVAVGAMPPDLTGKSADRWRSWHVKPPAADPDEWKYREGGSR